MYSRGSRSVSPAEMGAAAAAVTTAGSAGMVIKVVAKTLLTNLTKS